MKPYPRPLLLGEGLVLGSLVGISLAALHHVRAAICLQLLTALIYLGVCVYLDRRRIKRIQAQKDRNRPEEPYL